MDETDEIVAEFLVESYENLDQLDKDLLALERQPGDGETLGSIFRTVHTLKGTCGFLGFSKLERIAHVAENLLGKLRDGELDATAEIVTALFATGDATRATLAAIEQTGGEGAQDYSELVSTLEQLQERGDVPRLRGTPAGGGAAEGDLEPEVPGEPGATGSTLAQGSIRVDVGLLDDLMNLVGELVLARNQMLQLGDAFDEATFSGATQRLNLITSELQEGVMKTRMQPISTVWSRFPRIVRDLAGSCGKQVLVAMEGEETELDKTIIEAIKDPLTHLVRNAVDHGIESPAAREARGKPAAGRLVLRAFHEGGQVNIEIADDGAGIDPEKVRAKAVERGVLTAEEARRLADREAVNLVFAPGFSTAESVTSVSGRGVGMDVVKTNVERIGGTVDVHSVPGAGTTFRVKIPLTLAIIPALIVTSGGERFAIPQVSLLELVRLEGEQAASGIESMSDTPVYRLRGRLLPIVELDAQLGLSPVASARTRDVLNIVVLKTEGQPFGLVVDEVNDTQEIVVKPLGTQVRDVPVFAGATIMGDGRVALILDVLGLAARAEVVGQRAEQPKESEVSQEAGATGLDMLVVALGDDRRAAIPLAQVARLETFPADAVECAGGQRVVQYRGSILPLVSLSEAMGEFGDPGGVATGALEVVVHSTGGRDVGIHVQSILDIVRAPSQELGEDAPPPVSLVLQGMVTDLVDIDAVVSAWMPLPDYAGATS